jgi:hypothetical protein
MLDVGFLIACIQAAMGMVESKNQNMKNPRQGHVASMHSLLVKPGIGRRTHKKRNVRFHERRCEPGHGIASSVGTCAATDVRCQG